jgi:hypothetical protein
MLSACPASDGIFALVRLNEYCISRWPDLLPHGRTFVHGRVCEGMNVGSSFWSVSSKTIPFEVSRANFGLFSTRWASLVQCQVELYQVCQKVLCFQAIFQPHRDMEFHEFLIE